MKKMLAVVVSSIACMSAAHAAIKGPYLGVGLGEGVINTSEPTYNVYTQQFATHDKGGFSGKLFGGYNFDKYFGLELSYANFAHSMYRANPWGTDYPANWMTFSLKRTQEALSLVGKGYLPLSDSGFNLYVLGGMAEVASEVELDYSDVPLFPDSDNTYNSLLPTYGLGMSYDFGQHLTTSLEYSHIQGKGNVQTSPSAIPSTDLYTVNFAYNFG